MSEEVVLGINNIENTKKKMKEVDTQAPKQESAKENISIAKETYVADDLDSNKFNTYSKLLTNTCSAEPNLAKLKPIKANPKLSKYYEELLIEDHSTESSVRVNTIEKKLGCIMKEVYPSTKNRRSFSPVKRSDLINVINKIKSCSPANKIKMVLINSTINSINKRKSTNKVGKVKTLINSTYELDRMKFHGPEHSKASSKQFNFSKYEGKSSTYKSYCFDGTSSKKTNLRLVWWGKNNEITCKKSLLINTPLKSKQSKAGYPEIDLVSSSFISKVGVIKGLSNYNSLGERPAKYLLKYFK